VYNIIKIMKTVERLLLANEASFKASFDLALLGAINAVASIALHHIPAQEVVSQYSIIALSGLGTIAGGINAMVNLYKLVQFSSQAKNK